MWVPCDILPKSFDDEDKKYFGLSSDNYYVQFNFEDKEKIPLQGFKIHISATIHNYEGVINHCFEFCKNQKINFKYIAKRKEIEKNLNGFVCSWAIGKVITIYPTTHRFKNILLSLHNDDFFKRQQGVTIFSDRRYKDSELIFYRFGRLIGPGKEIVNPVTKEIEYYDYDSPTYKIPSWIKEPFPNNIDDLQQATKLYKEYIPIAAVNHKGSGATFIAKQAKEKREIILKNAHPNFFCENISIINLLKREKENLISLSDLDFIPKYVDDFFENKDYFLCEEKMEGIVASELRSLERFDFLNSKKRQDTLRFYRLLILDLLRKVDLLHKRKFFIGDISDNNLIINLNSGSVSFIDLAQSKYINKREPDDKVFFRTMGYYDKRIDDLSLLNQDKAQLVYLLISLFSRANMFLKLDNSGKTTIKFFKKYSSFYKIPQAFVTLIFKLYRNPTQSLKPLINELENADLSIEYHFEEKYDIQEIERNLKQTIFINQLKLKRAKEAYSKKENDSKDLFIGTLEYGSYEITKKLKKKIYDEWRINKIRMEGAVKQYSDLKSDDVIATLFCVIVYIKPELVDIQEYLKSVFNKFLIVSGKGYYLKITEGSSQVSPYLSNGSAGLLLCLLEIRQVYNTELYDSLILKLVKTLKSSEIPQRGSIINGLAGIVIAIYKYKTIFKDTAVDSRIWELVDLIPYYLYKNDKLLYLIDDTLGDVSVKFKDGNKGIVKIISDLKKNNFFNQEENL